MITSLRAVLPARPWRGVIAYEDEVCCRCAGWATCLVNGNRLCLGCAELADGPPLPCGQCRRSGARAVVWTSDVSLCEDCATREHVEAVGSS